MNPAYKIGREVVAVHDLVSAPDGYPPSVLAHTGEIVTVVENKLKYEYWDYRVKNKSGEAGLVHKNEIMGIKRWELTHGKIKRK